MVRMRVQGNLLAFLPALVAFLVALAVFASIFIGDEIGTGREIAPLLLLAELTQVAMVLSLVPQLAAAGRRLPPDGSAPLLERALRLGRQLWWLLLIAPVVSIALILLWPPTPQALFTVPSILAWVLPLLNLFPLAVGYLMLSIVSWLALGQRHR
jgi:hypothetical protein